MTANTPPATHIYHTLTHQKEIRLLRIQHGISNEAVQVHLEKAQLDSNVAYTALSYVWGDPSLPSSIKCNGHNFTVTRNLWEILDCFRQDRFGGLLWIDAICINQQDNEEKGIQVSMMRDIYKQAFKVIFWLGKQERYDEFAVGLISLFKKRHKPFSKLNQWRDKPLHDLNLPSEHPGWRGWASLLCRPWFSRVWIVQEFLNARSSSLFKSGALDIPRDDFVWFAYATGACAALSNRVSTHSTAIRTNTDIVFRAMALGIDLLVRDIAGAADDARIFDLWTRSQLLGATDPRDRVFALLSTQTAVGMDIVDYNKDFATVYTDIAETALKTPVSQTNWYSADLRDLLPSHAEAEKKERTSRFLACKYGDGGRGDELPSWVPDWRPVGFRYVPLTRYFPGTSWFVAEYHHAVVQGKRISISGSIFDSPSIIVDSRAYSLLRITSPPPDPLPDPQTVVNWHFLCYLLALSFYHPQPTTTSTPTSDPFAAFCSAMAFSRLPRPSPHTPPSRASYKTGFQALHTQLLNSCTSPLTPYISFSTPHVPTTQAVLYESVAVELAAGRKFAITRNGDMAWVPSATRLGDVICWLAGCAVPFVVRKAREKEEAEWELVGDCYVHGRMQEGNVWVFERPVDMVLT